MSGLEWFLAFTVAILYFALLFFFGVRTFQRGYLMLGVLGIFLPVPLAGRRLAPGPAHPADDLTVAGPRVIHPG